MKLTELSKAIKSQAVKLLDDGKVIETLKKYGEVKIVGSYSFDLMTDRDIDINLKVTGTGKEQSVEALNDFIRQGFFGGYYYFDWFKFQKPQFPKGYYVGLKARVNGEKWKIDIWFLEDEDERSLPVTKKLKSVSNDVRETILKLKKYRTENQLEISSYQIYEAVIDDGVRDELGLRQYITNKSNKR